MKRLLALLLSFSLLGTLCSCAVVPETVSEVVSETVLATVSETVSATASEVSDETSGGNEKTWPYVTGTFIQLPSFTSYTELMWKKHFKHLLEVGIDTVILQWCATTPYGKFSDAYYPASPEASDRSDSYTEYKAVIPRILKAAQKMGIKVFMGLNIADEWWSVAAADLSWYKNQAAVGMEIAAQLYELYKEDYPDAFYGWYFPWEYYNGIGHAEQAADFLNCYLDGLDAIDTHMPMMLSPFIRVSVSAEETKTEWSEIISKTHFRAGDIFCCQDAIGAGWMTIEKLPEYFAAVKEACSEADGLLFWANNEDFTQATWTPAPLERFVEQMELSSEYVSGHVTFAYSHYYAPDKSSDKTLHERYKEYYLTGVIPD